MQAVYENRHEDFYCRDSRYATGSLNYHSHLHYQIEMAVVWEGHTSLTVDSSEYDVRGGDAFVVFPNQIHEFRTLEKENYILLKINPELVPVVKNGEIVDVKVEYVDSYTDQMLNYSKNYSFLPTRN